MASADLLKHRRLLVGRRQVQHFGHTADRIEIRQFEDNLGRTLLNRTARGVGLTAASAELSPRATAHGPPAGASSIERWFAVVSAEQER